VLQLSSTAYAKSDERFDGDMNVTESDDKTLVTMDLNRQPEALVKKKEVLFKVNKKGQKGGKS
jgi:hypothetical protein